MRAPRDVQTAPGARPKPSKQFDNPSEQRHFSKPRQSSQGGRLSVLALEGMPDFKGAVAALEDALTARLTCAEFRFELELLGVNPEDFDCLANEVRQFRVLRQPALGLEAGLMSYSPLDLVEAYLKRFVAYPSDHALVAHVLWTAHTHLMPEHFDTTPRLAFMSAEKASGKTRALEVTSLLVKNAILSLSASPAVIVRLVSAEGGAVLYDEVDAVFGSAKAQEANADLCSLLNAGYRRGAKVRRYNIKTNAPEEFDAFAPVAVAGLRNLPDTLASRTIFIRMKRRAPGETVESFRWRQHSWEAEPIKQALGTWCEENAGKIDLVDHPPEMPDGIEDRAADIWEPLLAIADLASGDWPVLARRAAVALTTEGIDEAVTVGVELLEHVRDAFGGADRIWTTTLVERLCARDESPWKGMRNGQGIDDRGLARLLKLYGIKSKDVRIGQQAFKGYLADHFKDTWERYCTPAQGERDKRDKRDIFDNKNNFVADVADVAHASGRDLDGDPFALLRFGTRS